MGASSSDSWSQSLYNGSLSSRCWTFTPYDAGWDGSVRHGADLREDEELRQIVAMEHGLGPLPAWVRPVVEGPMRNVGFCGHYLFPLSFLDALGAIGSGRVPPLNHTCFTVDPQRKRRIQDYVLCLDGWLAGAGPRDTAAELAARETGRIDWQRLCSDLWQALGERSEMKALLVERLVHQLRWWLTATMWDGDDGSGWCRDQYLGEWREGRCLLTENGNPQIHAGGIDLSTSPRIQRIEARLAETCPDWNWFRTVIGEFSWPCAPKFFRFLEKVLWCIGRGRPVIHLPSFPLASPEPVPGFLQCEDTYPDPRQAAGWWREFLAGLRDWWQDRPGGSQSAADIAQRLGSPTPLKRWLVRLFAHRCLLLEQYGGTFGQLVGPSVGNKAGTRPIP